MENKNMYDQIMNYSQYGTTTRELAQTVRTDVYGASVTAYGLEPVLFLKSIVDAAKKQLFFTQFANVLNLQQGQYSASIPKRTAYLGRSDLTYSTTDETGPYHGTEGSIADVQWTALDSLTSVQVTPKPYIGGIALRNYEIRTNAVSLVQAAKEELSYGIGDKLDYAVAQAIGDATCAANDGTALGAQTLYGGDATAGSGLASGDVITTDLVAKAARYLKDSKLHYRDGTSGKSGTEALSSTNTKNPWQNTSDEPFVLFIGPAQEETFRKDSQFVNAAEYGSDKIVHTGEIGDYLGIRIIVTTNVESVAAATAGPDGTTNSTVGVTRCILMKSKKAVTIVWGQSPTLKVFDYANRDQTRLSLVCAYAIGAVHNDAVVFVDVTDA